MPLETKLTKLLGIRVPVVQGGMQWVGVPQLAAAVSNAGGLGILTALTQPTPDALRHAIRETRKLTKYPFGVNITLLPSINPPDYEGYARAAVEEGVRIFETAGNNPGPLIKYFKSQGCIVIHKCTTIRHAKSAERLGVDCLSIDGFESGAWSALSPYTISALANFSAFDADADEDAASVSAYSDLTEASQDDDRGASVGGMHPARRAFGAQMHPVPAEKRPKIMHKAGIEPVTVDKKQAALPLNH
ncbi:hypothetical protein NUW54_g2598 [Trametes sanguinea]|uniref:Uncharacterized protein n=1 Tax=Trametes sanguinea TaxID=158606 RepID=A0ACC1Q4C4_9APHY|nr:hypothetical protein NUW54_g2598 [Trametes sanguinea]